MKRPEPHYIDLLRHRGLTFALLDSTRDWRQRAVHEIVLRDSDHVHTSTAYQIRLPLEMIQPYAPIAREGDLIRLILPFTVRPNQLILNVDFEGTGDQPMTLLLRREIAKLQAEYVAYVDNRSPDDQSLVNDLWEAVSSYTTFSWWEHLGRTQPSAWRRLWPRSRRSWRRRALVAYLNDWVDFEIKPCHVSNWLYRTEGARRALVEALGEGEDPDSPAECILLAIPFVPVELKAINDIDEIIEIFSSAVMAMSHRSRQVLAEYGRRWEVFLETVVPVGQACTLKLTEQRPWVVAPSPNTRQAVILFGKQYRVPVPGRFRASSTMKQEIPFCDAETTHVEIRAADHRVVIDRPHIRVIEWPRISDLDGERVDFAISDAIRETPDAIAIYASRPDRPYLARIIVRARVRWVHRLLIVCLLLLTAAAGVVTVVLPENADLVASLALLVFPLTLAGAVALGRETTSLAERLLRTRRISLVVSIGVLWGLTLLRLLSQAGIEFAESWWHAVKHLPGW